MKERSLISKKKPWGQILDLGLLQMSKNLFQNHTLLHQKILQKPMKAWRNWEFLVWDESLLYVPIYNIQGTEIPNTLQGQASKWIVPFGLIFCLSCAASNSLRFCHWFCLSNNVNKQADATSIKTCTERDYPLGRLSLYFCQLSPCLPGFCV